MKQLDRLTTTRSSRRRNRRRRRIDGSVRDELAIIAGHHLDRTDRPLP